ncbi:reverse transcriptase domain-containing protein [Rhizobium sp. 1AS11]|nr:reverse transcriptase domain-containing protein [Rhizobium acaciae]MCW1745940.1 reverse transcriptase domain-containing protein [Rhizobium acaciae]
MRGTPQGGDASPLMANIYMNRFPKHWRQTAREAFQANVVAYANDFVILGRGCAAEALAWTKTVMTKLGLTLNELKISVKDAVRSISTSLVIALPPSIFARIWLVPRAPPVNIAGLTSSRLFCVVRPD